MFSKKNSFHLSLKMITYLRLLSLTGLCWWILMLNLLKFAVAGQVLNSQQNINLGYRVGPALLTHYIGLWITKYMQKREASGGSLQEHPRREYTSTFSFLNHYSVNFAHYHQLYIMSHFKIDHLSLYSYVSLAPKLRPGLPRAA